MINDNKRFKIMNNTIDNKSKLILNLIPVAMRPKTVIDYKRIYKLREQIVADPNQNKTDLMNNINIFCTFPPVMTKYYNSQLSFTDNFNQDKYEALLDLISAIFNKKPDVKVHVIYSNFCLREHYTDDHTHVLKRKVLDQFTEKRDLISFCEIDEIDNLPSDITHIIFLNVLLTENVKKLFTEKIFQAQKKVYMFQMFLENTVEHALVEQFYYLLPELLAREGIPLSKKLKNSQKDYIIKRFIINKFTNIDYNNNEQCIIYGAYKETHSLNINLIDGLIFNDGINKIYVKNSHLLNYDEDSKSYSDIVAEVPIEYPKKPNTNIRRRIITDEIERVERIERVDCTNVKQNPIKLHISYGNNFTLFARKDIILYFNSLRNNKNIVYEDIIWNISYIFLNHGFHKNVRDTIIRHIEHYGVDLDCFDEYLHNIIRKYNLSVNLEDLRFFIEYLLFMLSKFKSADDEKTLQMCFFSDTPKGAIIKKRILTLNRIKIFNEKKSRADDLRFILEKYSKDKRTGKHVVEILVQFCVNILECIPLFGYGIYF
jgi:hypothetical protein